MVKGITPKMSLDKGGGVWIRSGHSWKSKALLQPVQACEAKGAPACPLTSHAYGFRNPFCISLISSYISCI